MLAVWDFQKHDVGRTVLLMRMVMTQAEQKAGQSQVLFKIPLVIYYSI